MKALSIVIAAQWLRVGLLRGVAVAQLSLAGEYTCIQATQHVHAGVCQSMSSLISLKSWGNATHKVTVRLRTSTVPTLAPAALLPPKVYTELA